MVLETVTTCSNNNVKMAAYAHFTAGASIKSLKYVWGTLLIVDSQYGYYPEATKEEEDKIRKREDKILPT